MNNSIEIKGLNKFYGKKQALFDVNLSIQQGMFGLLGRNGAGKTTLMKTLATLLQKKDGEITVCGVPIENVKEIRKIIGYLPQEFSMYPSMNVDEPTAGLDPEERVRFRNLLSEIAEDKIVILSTHIVGDIEATCEDIAIINEGKVIYNGTVDELLQAAEGRVFTMTVSKRELPQLKRQLSITSMHTQGSKVHIRFIADTLMQGAKVCEPNIEDAYMLYLHSSGVREILGEIGG